jgi:hemerythrin superfamily protein
MPTEKKVSRRAPEVKRRSSGTKRNPPEVARRAAPKDRAMGRDARARGKDAIALLEADHQKVRGLLRELEGASAKPRREQLLTTIEHEIKLHSKIEEEIFYPAYREAAKTKEDRKLYFEAIEEHHVVDVVLPEIKGTDAGSDEFAAKAKVLKDLIEHHAEEEETEMFPRAKTLMDREELLRLGEQLAKAKESLTGGIITKLAGLVGL